MDNNRIDRLIRELPKVDLHLHLDGSVRPGTIMDLADEHGIELPGKCAEELIPFMQVNETCTSLGEYLSKFHFTTRFLQTAAALERVAYEIVEQAAGHSCKYVEVRFAPQLHREKGLSAEEAIHAVLQGLKRGELQFGVKARAIAICMRNHSERENREVIEAAASFIGKGLVAADLAGDEASYPPERFRGVFAFSQKRDIPITIHAGEAAGADNIYEAVENLGAARIGHGVRLKENPRILEIVADRRIPLEMCPISNIQTKAVPSWESYPIRDYFERGLHITVNTDNPSVSGTNITQEYRVLAEKFGFTVPELAKLAMNGLEAAFLEEHEKKALRKEFRRRLSELGIVSAV
ncbi:adenosine deaminase [Paenibacillus hamazuiensis]|uniref:adenosine deaminase n=1 Tax=Paenibacillus hamazuiensis TaxID=2936508 RepID=UPI00200BDBFA|nr:adenosine deaminase [Paenibacillus hamazuiensis]